MKQIVPLALAALFVAFSTGCGVAPSAAPTLGSSSDRLSARNSTVAFQECLATDETILELEDSMRLYMATKAWKSTLKNTGTVASRSVNGGTEYLVTGVFEAGSQYEATVLAKVDRSKNLVDLKEACSQSANVLPLPFKKASATELKSLHPKLASYLKAKWDAELASLQSGTVLARTSGNVYRLNVALKSGGFPLPLDQHLEVRLNEQGTVVAVENF